MREKKSIKFRLAIFTLLMGLILPFSHVNADYWGASNGASQWKQMMEQIMKQIQDAIMAALKQAAAEMITNTVNNLISQGSGGGGPMFVTNWEDFLINEPGRRTNLYMNDFFTSLTGGRSGLSYASGSRSEGTLGGNYYMYIESVGRNSIAGSASPVNAYEYCNDPLHPLTGQNGGSLRCFSSTAGNSFDVALQSQKVYYSELERQQRIAEVQGIAYQGFRPGMSGGSVTTPGSTIAAIQAQNQDLPNKILASAKSPGEVIASLVTRLITKTIRQGIGTAQQMAQQQINSTMNFNNQVKSATDPRAIFKPSY